MSELTPCLDNFPHEWVDPLPWQIINPLPWRIPPRAGRPLTLTTSPVSGLTPLPWRILPWVGRPLTLTNSPMSGLTPYLDEFSREWVDPLPWRIFLWAGRPWRWRWWQTGRSGMGTRTWPRYWPEGSQMSWTPCRTSSALIPHPVAGLPPPK